jgi:hypothetical protein
VGQVGHLSLRSLLLCVSVCVRIEESNGGDGAQIYAWSGTGLEEIEGNPVPYLTTSSKLEGDGLDYFSFLFLQGTSLFHFSISNHFYRFFIYPFLLDEVCHC